MATSNTKNLERDFESGKVMICPECHEIVSISECKWVERTLTTIRTLKDIIKDRETNLFNTRMIKNGQIQKMHKLVGQLLSLMDGEQLKKAKEINKTMREEIRRWEKNK